MRKESFNEWKARKEKEMESKREKEKPMREDKFTYGEGDLVVSRPQEN